MTPCTLARSAARLASSSISRSPAALLREMRTPESRLARDCLARAQFSIRILATRSSSTFFLAASASAACFLFASSSLSTPLGRGARRAFAASAVVLPASPGGVASLAVGARSAAVGRLTMSFSMTSGGGTRSLNTLRPSLSSHCHCAMTVLHAPTRARPRTTDIFFMAQSVAVPLARGQCTHGYNLPFGALTCAFSAKR
jgi:hypothetical protein